MRSTRLANVQQAGVARSEQVWFLRLGSAPLRSCVSTGKVQDQQACPLVSYVLGLAVLSREDQSSEVQRLLHVVQGCRPCTTCAAANRRPLPSRCCSGRRWRGKRTQSVEMPSFVKALVRWAAGKTLTNRLTELSHITLSPPLSSGILGLRVGPYVPTPKFFTISGDPGRVFIRFLT